MALSLENLVVSHAQNTLLKVNVCVKDGEILTVMGPSGAGKSTLLQAITGQLHGPFSLAVSLKLTAL